ncbi:hypothetical protein PAPYR_4582 [Paratrimastix pyriformis]|uniref:GEX2 N-terminal Ig-like domain-containing protein n=1 Tax=Paratrimastix pyriformis TaxID=342808 RepID=A0ABQ8UJY3_9EUKA|nr:hypothetical protein PAPYR_4582 [Paratrimastix pyriformis]
MSALARSSIPLPRPQESFSTYPAPHTPRLISVVTPHLALILLRSAAVLFADNPVAHRSTFGEDHAVQPLQPCPCPDTPESFRLFVPPRLRADQPSPTLALSSHLHPALAQLQLLTMAMLLRCGPTAAHDVEPQRGAVEPQRGAVEPRMPGTRLVIAQSWSPAPRQPQRQTGFIRPSLATMLHTRLDDIPPQDAEMLRRVADARGPPWAPASNASLLASAAQLTAGANATVTVQARDVYGNPVACSNATAASAFLLQAACGGSGDSSAALAAQWSCTAGAPALFAATFVPSQAGACTLAVLAAPAPKWDRPSRTRSSTVGPASPLGSTFAAPGGAQAGEQLVLTVASREGAGNEVPCTDSTASGTFAGTGPLR